MKKNNKIKTIFLKLYDYYGPQGWWPIVDKNYQVRYRKNFFGKLSDDECFEISSGAILTQNVSWKNVEKAIINLKKNNLLNPYKINDLDFEFVSNLIRSTGYYKQKTIKLKNFSKWIIEKGGSLKKIFNKTQPLQLRNMLLSINGIGKETADSILLYAAYIPFFIIDAYTKRLINRVLNIELTDYDELQNLFHKSIEKDFKIYNEFHALIVQHSKNFCRKEPLCSSCPLSDTCLEVSYGNNKANRRIFKL